MATFSSRSSTLSFNLQIFIFLFLTAKLISSFASQALDNNPNFDPHISLFGDARVEDGSSTVQLTRSHAPSSGLLLMGTPFKSTVARNVGQPTSFSTEFSFSIAPANCDGLAFVLIPNGFHTRFQGQGSFGLSGEKTFLGVEFDTKKDDKAGNFNANHVRIDIHGPEESVKTSSRVDVYSWRFRVRAVPSWMHSLPADPRGYMDKDSKEIGEEKGKSCALTILARLIFAALFAFVMLFMWTIFVRRHTVFAVKCEPGHEDFRSTLDLWSWVFCIPSPLRSWNSGNDQMEDGFSYQPYDLTLVSLLLSPLRS
ncbi:hypothetical protein HRI_002158200 [Hibiscus trionum]|uniref:Legume lectin domain-containing protein n=1 Tax=Hibiscus trionum TaxID=183268 RepID=A0A9W7M1S1_HIBTR|nr:hypothetical protein HRI_002158200 [Hibiscus trionum]